MPYQLTSRQLGAAVEHLNYHLGLTLLFLLCPTPAGGRLDIHGSIPYKRPTGRSHKHLISDIFYDDSVKVHILVHTSKTFSTHHKKDKQHKSTHA